MKPVRFGLERTLYVDVDPIPPKKTEEVPVPELVSYSQFGNFDIYSKYFLVLSSYCNNQHLFCDFVYL
jgi:hypothetical protein